MMLLRAKRTVVWGLFASLILATPLAAHGNDLGDAVDFAQKHFDRRTRDDFEPQWQKRSRHEALGMLSSRDVDEEKALGAYDCLDSAIDTMPIMRSSGKEKAALRGCLKHRFERSHLPGYRTLGTVRLDEVHVRPMIESEAAKHEVPAIVLNTIIMLVSGFRPHAVSEQGHLGLMQLRPDLLAAEGITHDDLLEPGENIRAGAAYVRALVFKYGGLRKAMLAYADGGIDMTYKSRSKRWFVDNTMSIYFGSDRKFPYKLGAENIKFVWTWLE